MNATNKEYINYQKEDWVRYDKCPICEMKDTIDIGNIPIKIYNIGSFLIEIPHSGIRLLECKKCHLIFKDKIFSKAFIKSITSKSFSKISWNSAYNWYSEVSLLNNLFPSKKLDIFDVGAFDGNFLNAIKNNSIVGTRSAMDIVQHEHIHDIINGSFFICSIDETLSVNIESTYDVLTMFDVVEHLTSPNDAIKTIRKLIKTNGYLIIETGNPCSHWPRKFSIPNWWYVCLFEHTMFWSIYCLKTFFNKHGFKTIFVEKLRHKQKADMKLLEIVKSELKSISYYLSPDKYIRFMQKINRYDIQPSEFFTKDHYRLVLQKYK